MTPKDLGKIERGKVLPAALGSIGTKNGARGLAPLDLLSMDCLALAG